MSYYEDVYLARLNKYGTSRQERILGTKRKRFETFLAKSMYRVSCDYSGLDTFIGSLQPMKNSDGETIIYLLTSSEVILPIGAIIEITDLNPVTQGQNSVTLNWIISYIEPNTSFGYNQYTIYLLDRLLTWWDSTNQEHQTGINLLGAYNKQNKDIFINMSRNPSYRESQNFYNFIMAFDPVLKQDYYCTLNGSPRSFIISGFDCETTPGLQYVTIDLTMTRDSTTVTSKPSSFWSGG